VESSFNSQKAAPYHLGTRPTIRRSTLADANHNGSSWPVFSRVQAADGQVGRRFRQEVGDLLYLLDFHAHSAEGAGLRRLSKDKPQPPHTRAEGPCTDDLGQLTPVESIITAAERQ